MKIRSNKALSFSAGREGIKSSVIEISISVNKNTEAKTVNLSINDSEVIDDTVTSTVPMPMTRRGINNSYESHSYEEFQVILETIKAAGTYTQTGYELEDILIQEYLYQKVTTEKWYNSLPANWVKI